MTNKKWLMFLVWMGLVVFNSSFLFASSGFVADSFDAPKTKNIMKRGDFVGGGKKDARVPFVNSDIVKDETRGSVLEMKFNVSEGYGGTYIIFLSDKIPANFNSVSFWIRGTLSSFKIEMKDEQIHSYVVPKRSSKEWQKIEIPVSKFSNSESMDKRDIKEFVFVFEDHRTSPRLGTIHIDDLVFSESNGATEREKIIPAPSIVLVDGDIPINRTVKADGKRPLKLTSRVANKGEFVALRFEATSDQKHWFLLSEIPFH